VTKCAYEIRLMERHSAGHEVASDLTNLHCALLPHSPLVKLGRKFMREVYYKDLAEDALISGAIAYLDGVPAGFIVGTGDPNGFMSKGLRRHWFKIAWTICTSVVTGIASLRGLNEARRIEHNVKSEGYGPEFGEILSFGVLHEFRTRQFVRERGLLIGQDLHDVIVELLRRQGKSKVRAIVDKDNLQAQFFYRSQGWRVGLTSVEGWSVPTMEFVLDLPTGSS